TLGPASSIQTVQVPPPGLPTVGFTAGIGSVYMTLLEPAFNGVVGDSALVKVRIDSAAASIASVQAEAAGGRVTLPPGGAGIVQGPLVLTGVPHGARDLRVLAVTTAGDSSVLMVPV